MVGLCFFGAVALTLITGLNSGDSGVGVNCGLLILAPLLSVPLFFYAITWYSRVEIEPGGGIRRFKIYRVIGYRRTLDLPWDSVLRLHAVAVRETDKSLDSDGHEDWRRTLAWRIIAEFGDGQSIVVANCEPNERFAHLHAKAVEGLRGPEAMIAALAKEERLLNQILVSIRPYLREKLVLHWNAGEQKPQADGEPAT